MAIRAVGWLWLGGALALGAGAARGAPLQELGAGEGFVDIVAWPGYIERGDRPQP